MAEIPAATTPGPFSCNEGGFLFFLMLLKLASSPLEDISHPTDATVCQLIAFRCGEVPVHLLPLRIKVCVWRGAVNDL